jgi:hypothetical protein
MEISRNRQQKGLKMLTELCLKKSKTGNYRCNRFEHLPILHTRSYGIGSTIRKRYIQPDYFKIESEESVDQIFVNMIDGSSTILHDLYVFSAGSEPKLTEVVTEMGRWDMIPHCLIISNSNKMPIFKHKTSIYVGMKGCTCSNIINNSFVASFPVSIYRTYIPKYKDCNIGYEAGYLLSKPSVCGRYHKSRKSIKMLVRPVSCFKMVFDYNNDSNSKLPLIKKD